GMSVIEKFLKETRFDDVKIFGFCLDCGEMMRECGVEYENGWEVSRVCPKCGFSMGENAVVYRENIGLGKILRLAIGPKWIGGMPTYIPLSEGEKD
ncbi:unnamed protein product, partial [marine sediment metagenome]